MNENITEYYRMPLALLLAASLVACGTDSGSSGGSPASGDGFTLRVTDAPFDHAARVDVWLNAVHVKPADGDWIEIPTKPTIMGLASLQGTKSLALVTDVDLPPGDYSAVRLIVDETRSEVELISGLGGGIYDLDIPTGANPGLIVNEPFTIHDNQPTELVLDIDLRGSVIEYGTPLIKQYRLLPRVRVAHGNNYGHIRGKVDSSLLDAGSCSDSDSLTYNAVYVFKGHDARLTDIKPGNSNGDLVTTSKINWDEGTKSHIYEAGFLPTGDYTIALTCNADRDDPERNDDVSDLRFFGVKETVVKVKDLFFF